MMRAWAPLTSSYPEVARGLHLLPRSAPSLKTTAPAPDLVRLQDRPTSAFSARLGLGPSTDAPSAPSSPRSRPGPRQAPVRLATAPPTSSVVGPRVCRRPRLLLFSTGPELSPCTPGPVGSRPVDDRASSLELARCRAFDLVGPRVLPRDCPSCRVGPPSSLTTAPVPYFLTEIEGRRSWWGREEQGQRGPAPALGRRRGCTPARADSLSLSRSSLSHPKGLSLKIFSPPSRLASLRLFHSVFRPP